MIIKNPAQVGTWPKWTLEQMPSFLPSHPSLIFFFFLAILCDFVHFLFVRLHPHWCAFTLSPLVVFVRNKQHPPRWSVPCSRTRKCLPSPPSCAFVHSSCAKIAPTRSALNSSALAYSSTKFYFIPFDHDIPATDYRILKFGPIRGLTFIHILTQVWVSARAFWMMEGFEDDEQYFVRDVSCVLCLMFGGKRWWLRIVYIRTDSFISKEGDITHGV